MTNTIQHDILAACIERMESLGLKGKRRDNEALTYLCGACKVLELLDSGLANNIRLILVMLIATRGYKEVVELAKPVAA